MLDNIDKPIEVTSNTIPIAAGLRYALVMLGTFAVGRGWVPQENIEGIVTTVLTVGTALYGLYRTYRNKQKLVVAADAAPNSVARVV